MCKATVEKGKLAKNDETTMIAFSAIETRYATRCAPTTDSAPTLRQRNSSKTVTHAKGTMRQLEMTAHVGS